MVLDSLPIGVAVNSVDPVAFTYINDNFVKFYRTTREALSDADAFWEAAYQDPNVREAVRRQVMADVASGDIGRMRWNDIPITREGEETTYISAMNAPIRGMQSMLSMVWDTTERKRAEESLRASEEKYRQIVETAQEGIWTVDAENRTTYVNRRMAEMLGYSVDEMVGQPVFAFMDEDAIELAKANLVQPRQGLHEFMYQRKNGSPLWTYISTNPIYDQDGRYCGAQALVTDITDLKQTQRAEQEQRVLADALAETATALISVLDLDSVMHTLLENVARVVPHDAANIMLVEGESARPVYWRGYDPEYVTYLQGTLFPVQETPSFLYMIQTGSPYLFSYTDQDPNWITRPKMDWIKSHISAPIRSHGMVIGFLNLDSQVPGHFTEAHMHRLRAFADQTSITIEHAQLYEEIRRHAQELEQRVIERTAQLNHAKERIEAILNSSSDVMIMCRTDGLIDQVNPAFDAVFGCIEDGAHHLPLTDLVSPENVAKLQQAFDAVLESRQPRRVEVTVLCTERAPFVADVVLSPIAGHDSTLLGVVCNLRDMTPHKMMEAQLRQMLRQAMELSDLKSRYVSMAAHDLRNPLAVIQSSVSMVRLYGDRLTPRQLQEKYDRVESSIMVMVDMLDDILTLGRAESGNLTFNPAPLDVIAFCHDLAAEMGQVDLGSSRVMFSYQGECGTAMMDAKLLRHILGNLLSNALKYSPDLHPVNFDVRCGPDEITFQIRDQGIGIPAGDQKRLFEAFFRASNAKAGLAPGTGLGLAIVKQSVVSHGGTITFESQEGIGTTFTVVLPRHNLRDTYEKDTGDR